MKVKQLQQLLAIVEYGSMNAAAKALYLARSSLASSMKSLEAEFGQAIFDRRDKAKGAVLTPFGNEVYQQATLLCAQFDTLQNLSHHQKKPLSVLHVSNMHSPLADEAFLEVYHRHKDDAMGFHIRECSTTEALHQVETGITEVAVISLFSHTKNTFLRQMVSKGLTYHKLADKQLYVFVGPHNPLYHTEQPFLTLSDLDNYAFASYHAAMIETGLKQIFPNHLRTKPDISLSNLRALYRFLEETDVFTIDVLNPKENSEQMQDADNRSLRRIPLHHPGFTIEFGWICKKDFPLSALAEEYTKILTEKTMRFLTEKPSAEA